jgi:hypothetical protein
MTEILSKAGFSESLIVQLRLDEQRVADIKGKLAERTRGATQRSGPCSPAAATPAK